MKTLAAAAVAALFLAACPAPGTRTYDAFLGKDKEMPCVLAYEMQDNCRMRLVYDEEVTLIDIEFDGMKLDYQMHGTVFMIPFQRTIGKGSTAILSVTAEDNAGNTTRSSFRLVGKNLDIPEAVINELSIKGTAEQPDRIEILFLEDGNAAGMILADGLVEDANHILILPDIEVRAYDMIVVYWDREPESTETIITGESRGYIVSGGSDTTLSGTNGAVLLLSEQDGEIMDGLVYTTGESDLADGYGNNRTRNAALFMLSYGEWEGEPVSSSLVTASRVIARLPGAPDSNSADDFFITEARKSSFGKPNGYFPYDGD